VVDLSRLTPGPYCTMMLADFGADVIRVDPVGRAGGIPLDPFGRNKRSISLDLKSADAQRVLHNMVAGADVVVEGFLPGVAGRLAADEPTLRSIKPDLIYCSITGWGQTGPMANEPGHDIQYVALSGALAPIGRPGLPPNPPLNLVADMGGGGLLAAFGVLAALIAREQSGEGQHIDSAMLEGAMSLNLQTFAVHAAGMPVGRGTGWLDGGAPSYDTYETADGRFYAVGAIEPKFFAEFWKVLGLEPVDQHDIADWPRQKEMVQRRFLERTRDEWTDAFAGTASCTTPVLELDEVASHPHNAARQSFVDIDGVLLPGPVPRLSSTPGTVRAAPPSVGAHTRAVLGELGYDPAEIDRLLSAGVAWSP
jgi:alpha-methylacyl-CoA racemase